MLITGIILDHPTAERDDASSAVDEPRGGFGGPRRESRSRAGRARCRKDTRRIERGRRKAPRRRRASAGSPGCVPRLRDRLACVTTHHFSLDPASRRAPDESLPPVLHPRTPTGSARRRRRRRRASRAAPRGWDAREGGRGGRKLLLPRDVRPALGLGAPPRGAAPTHGGVHEVQPRRLRALHRGRREVGRVHRAHVRRRHVGWEHGTPGREPRVHGERVRPPGWPAAMGDRQLPRRPMVSRHPTRAPSTTTPRASSPTTTTPPAGR